MKDLKFTGGTLPYPVVIRVDSIAGNGNMTLLETYGLDDREPKPITVQVQKDLISTFKKVIYVVTDFVAFATLNSLTLQITNSDGSGLRLLAGQLLVVTAPISGASGVSTTPTFTGTTLPFSVVTIVVDAATQTVTADLNGAFTKVSSTLTSGAKSAVITSTKDGVSKSVTRTFTIS